MNNERRLKEYDELFIPQLSHFFQFCIATTDPMTTDPMTTDPTTTETTDPMTTELTTTKSKTTESDPTTTNPTNLHSSLHFWSPYFLRYVDGAAERERLEQEKKEAKLEKLRKVAEVKTCRRFKLYFSQFNVIPKSINQGQLHNRDKHTFSDPQYDKARSEVEEKVNLGWAWQDLMISELYIYSPL